MTLVRSSASSVSSLRAALGEPFPLPAEIDRVRFGLQHRDLRTFDLVLSRLSELVTERDGLREQLTRQEVETGQEKERARLRSRTRLGVGTRLGILVFLWLACAAIGESYFNLKADDLWGWIGEAIAGLMILAVDVFLVLMAVDYQFE